MDIIPAPIHLEPREGAFRFDGALTVRLPALPRLTAAALRVIVPGLTWASRSKLELVSSDDASVRFVVAAPEGLRGRHGYTLTVDATGIELRAATKAGFLSAAQSLRQLLPPASEGGGQASEPVTMPGVHIEDAPRFGWRGLHVDVARHMFTVPELKRLVDTMSLHKLNRLHWHLTDDQGWRIEIRSRPRLTEVGAWRAESPRRGARTEGDGVSYGGFYTQQEVRELVAYAAGCGVTIVPEIDLPGHMQAAIAAYPELGHGEAPEVWTRWGVSERILNVADETLAFVEDVLTEVAGLFPSPWLHLGGDEVPTTEWDSDEAAQARIATEGLAGPRQLQGWFLRRAAAHVKGLRRRAVCWDELLECDGPEDAIVMAWREAAHARTAAARGHDVVLCPQPYCYFDHYQGPEATEPEAIGGHTDLRKVLSLDPLDGDWTEAERAHLLGVQGNLWSEYIHDAAHLEYMAWPRGAALAEVAWSPAGAKDPADFEYRWRKMAERLDAMGVNHRRLDT